MSLLQSVWHKPSSFHRVQVGHQMREHVFSCKTAGLPFGSCYRLGGSLFVQVCFKVMR